MRGACSPSSVRDHIKNILTVYIIIRLLIIKNATLIQLENKPKENDFCLIINKILLIRFLMSPTFLKVNIWFILSSNSERNAILVSIPISFFEKDSTLFIDYYQDYFERSLDRSTNLSNSQWTVLFKVHPLVITYLEVATVSENTWLWLIVIFNAIFSILSLLDWLPSSLK